MKPNLDRARAWPVTPGTKGRRAVLRGMAWPCALLGIVALLSVGCGGSEEDAAPVIRPVRYQTIFSTGGDRTRSFSGLSRASVESRLSFKVPGTVTRVAVSVGDHVKSGRVNGLLRGRQELVGRYRHDLAAVDGDAYLAGAAGADHGSTLDDQINFAGFTHFALLSELPFPGDCPAVCSTC